MNNPVLFIIGLVLGLACFGYMLYRVIKFVKVRPLGGAPRKLVKPELHYLIALVLGQGILTIASSYGLVLMNGWELGAFEHIMIIFGSYLFGSGTSALFASFILHFYAPDIDSTQKGPIFYQMFGAIALLILGFYLFTQSIADHLSYPLANSISFTKGFGFPDGGNYGFTIAFYGIIMVGGAVVSYFVCDHIFYKKYGKHGILETLLIVAFPAGVIGGRLWYCLVLEPETYLSNPIKIFDIRSGGMGIMGGALLGIIAGVFFMLKFRKFVNIRYAMDVIIPSILIAQGIGRLGNFFNQEVYGGIVSYESIAWLPKIIVNNMYISGYYRLPLFLIEAVINIAGYFVIRYAIGKTLTKKLSLGDLGFSYLIWYGLTRVALEPLREGFTLNLGSSAAFGYLQSWIVAFVLVGLGILGIIGCHVYDYIRKRKGLEPRNLDTI